MQAPHSEYSPLATDGTDNPQREQLLAVATSETLDSLPMTSDHFNGGSSPNVVVCQGLHTSIKDEQSMGMAAEARAKREKE